MEKKIGKIILTLFIALTILYIGSKMYVDFNDNYVTTNEISQLSK